MSTRINQNTASGNLSAANLVAKKTEPNDSQKIEKLSELSKIVHKCQRNKKNCLAYLACHLQKYVHQTPENWTTAS